jgi:hypothetical protein
MAAATATAAVVVGGFLLVALSMQSASNTIGSRILDGRLPMMVTQVLSMGYSHGDEQEVEDALQAPYLARQNIGDVDMGISARSPRIKFKHWGLEATLSTLQITMVDLKMSTTGDIRSYPGSCHRDGVIPYSCMSRFKCLWRIHSTRRSNCPSLERKKI